VTDCTADVEGALAPGDRVEFVAGSPLYAMGLRSATVVSAGEPLGDLWERQAARLGVSVAWLRRRFVRQFEKVNGRPPAPGWSRQTRPVVALDPGGPVWAPLEVGVEPDQVRRVGGAD
jgi:hypothetical protein